MRSTYTNPQILPLLFALGALALFVYTPFLFSSFFDSQGTSYAQTQNSRVTQKSDYKTNTSSTTPQKNVDQLQIQRLRDLSQKIMEDRVALNDQLFSVFQAIFIVFGAVIGALGILGYLSIKYIRKELIDSAHSEVKNLMDHELAYGTSYAQANSYVELSFTLWAFYEKSFQEGREYSLYERYVEVSREMAERGLDHVESEAYTAHLDEPKVWLNRLQVINSWVYHTTVKFYNENKNAEKEGETIPHKGDSPKVRELIERANELLDQSQDKKAESRPTQWYDLRETASFAKAYLGTEEEKEEGKRELIYLIEGTSGYRVRRGFAKIPLDWRIDRWNEHNDFLDLNLKKPQPQA